MTSRYDAEYDAWRRDPEGFWARAAEDIHWDKRWDKVLDASDPPFYRWFAGARVNWVKVSAFVFSALAATLAGIVAAGNASSTVNLTIGTGLEFQAITAVVLGGVVLGGGKGSLIAAILGALTLYFIDPLFRELSIDGLLRPTLQGIILIAAVAYAARSGSLRWRNALLTTQPLAMGRGG